MALAPEVSEDTDDREPCPRCGVRHLRGDFQGEVCGWCAEDLRHQKTLQAFYQDGRW